MFAQFLEYCGKYADGSIRADHAYKWYDLLYGASNRRVKLALAECGFKSNELIFSLGECAARVRERGYSLDEGTLQQYLLEWYVWRRINAGEYRKWKKR